MPMAHWYARPLFLSLPACSRSPLRGVAETHGAHRTVTHRACQVFYTTPGAFVSHHTMSARMLTSLAGAVYTVIRGWRQRRLRLAPVAEWYTRQVEGLCPKGRGGSSPLGGTRSASMTCGVNSARRVVSRAASSAGRASRLHREGQGFESLAAHLYLNCSPKHKATRRDQMEAEALIKPVRAGVLLLGVQHDLPHLMRMEVAHRLRHEPRADSPPLHTRMHRDTHEVARCGVHRVELVAYDACVILRHDEIWVGRSNFEKVRGVMAPELVESMTLHLHHASDVGRHEWADAHLHVALVGDSEVVLVIRAQQRDKREAALVECRREPV